ncbi:hypothetical protein ACA910_007870 [Epithemia clementina (nom. ined.)]
MLRNLATSLITHERIVTTFGKAMEVRGLAERLITYAKKEDKLHGRRLANQYVFTKDAQTKLMNVLGPRYQFREGGYTRVMKLARPQHINKADMAVIEYVDRPGEIRAARPPTSFQNKTIEEVMKELGIEDPVKKQIAEIESGEEEEKKE